MRRILLIEDNADLAYGLRNNLELEGYAVESCANGADGLASLNAVAPDLVILDLMLPETDGFTVLKEIRRRSPRLPVLILTARGEEMDKVTGLRLGADDYVTKPFGLLELLARVEALLRRAAGDGEERHQALRLGAIEIDPAARTVTQDGAVVELTPKELDLLLALLRRGGAVVSRDELLAEVWGYSAGVRSRTVDTHVSELRRKLERDPSQPRHILTVSKAGYRLLR